MRIAIAIGGLLLLVGFLFQGIFVNALAREDVSTWRAGVSGAFVAVPWLFAALYVFWLPRLATGLFIVAGVLAWLGAATTSHADLWVWGAVAFALAAFSYVSARQKKEVDTRSRQHDETPPTMVPSQTTMVAAMTAPLAATPTVPMPISAMPIVAPVMTIFPCPSCGMEMDTEQRFCQECGAPAPARPNSRHVIPVR